MPPQTLEDLMRANGAIAPPGAAAPAPALALSASTPDDPLAALMQANGAEVAPMNTAVVNGQPVPVDAGPEDNTLGTYGRHVWQQANPVNAGQMLPFPKALGGSGVDNPFNPVKLKNDMVAVHKQAEELWKQGATFPAVVKLVESYLPYLGPMMSEKGDQLERGEYAAAAGDLTGMALGAKLQGAGAKAITNRALVGRPTVRAMRDPVNQLAERVGVRQTVGQATGNPFLQATGHMAGFTPIGALIEYWRANKNQKALAVAREDAAQGVRPGGRIEKTDAGMDVEQALTARQTAQGRIASGRYRAYEQVANDPAHATQVVPRRGEKPVTMAMPIDVRAIRATLRPVWQQMQTFTDLTKQGIGDAVTSFRSLMQGDDFMPLTVAEKHLGELKKIVRKTTGNERRLATQAVKELQRTIDQTLAQADPSAAQALKIGRAATRAKYKTEKMIEKTFGADAEFREQGGPITRMLAAGDRNIQMLRRVKAQAPQAIPGVARAFVDQLFDQRGEKMLADWKNLGPQKKALLFTPEQIDLLDNLTELHARIARSPNPSGSATSAVAALTGLGGWVTTPWTAGATTLASGAWSGILQSKAAVRLATRALKIAVQPTTSQAMAAARATSVAKLLQLAQTTAMQAADAAADNQDDDGDQ